MKQCLTVILWLIFWVPLTAQALVVGDTAYYPESHPVAYEQLVYKSAPQIDELTPVVLENLALRVYYPTDLEPGEQRPLVVLVHGGGFIGGSFVSFFDEAEALASLGYIAASVQYRLCKRVDCSLAAALEYPCNVSWANSLIPSGYVAAVDVADAINWLQLHAGDYHIDPEKVAVGGHSAGGWTSLHMAFMDMEEINDICPGCGVWPDYLGETLSPVSGLRAVLNMSGALLDTAWIDAAESEVAVMSIHGTDDGVVHYGTEPVYPCCNTYTFPIQGSCPITARQKNLTGNFYLLTGTDYGHDVFESQWWEQSEEQILWFLAKSFFSDDDFQVHVEMVRPSPVPNCPGPLPPIIPAELCGIPLEAEKTVLFEEPVTTEMIPLYQGRDIAIFPNPARDEVTFQSKNRTPTWQLALVDLTGQKIRAWEVGQNGSQTISLVGIPPGCYHLICRTTNGEPILKRLIVTQ